MAEWIAIVSIAVTAVGGLVAGAVSAGRAAQKLKDVAQDVSEIKTWTATRNDTIVRGEARLDALESDVSQLKRRVTAAPLHRMDPKTGQG